MPFNTQNLLFIDKHVIATIRIVGFFVSELLGILSFLVAGGVFHTGGEALWLGWPVGIAMIGIGFLQGFWNPYTQRKVLLYVYSYCFLGLFLSIFILGFSTVVFLGWLLLIMVMQIYFDNGVATIGMVSMAVSALGWLGVHADQLSLVTVLSLVGNSLVVIALVEVVAAIWRLTNDAIHQLELSHDQQDFEHERLNSLIDSMADGVIAVSDQLKVVMYNGAALNILDRNDTMKDRSLSRLVKLFDQNGQPVSITELVKAAKVPTTSRDLLLHYADGSRANLYLSIAPVHLGYGTKGDRGYVLLLRDITREKSLEEERDEFISVVSHELRTPIAITEGNIGNAQFIANKSGSLKQIKEALQASHDQIVFLAGLVNDLSTLSRAERGVLQLEVEAINPHQLVTELAEGYQDQAAVKKLAITTELDPNLETLHSSALYTREILQNFVTNAIKYTEKGSVNIGAKADPKGVRFTVRDTGIGISKSDQEKIFDKFFRSEDYRTRQNNGTGLGLYVTMKLARLLHAEISVQSELNHGSTFTIFIPNLQ